MTQKRTCLFTVLVMFILSMSLVLWWQLRPLLLTRMHESELRMPVQKYLEVRATVKGWRDPDIMAQVATGNRLKDMIRFRCDNCPSVVVATRISIKRFEVLEYSSILSKVRARVEYGWRLVEPNTNTVMGPCHAQAYTIILFLAKEDTLWKVSDVEDIHQTEANRVDDSSELLSKYCSSN